MAQQKGVAPREVQRETVWGPEAAFIGIDKNAVRKTFIPEGKKKSLQYLECRKAVIGGSVQMFVFGENIEELLGELVPASVELWTRSENGREVHYLRAKILPETTRPDVKLYVGSGDDPNVTLFENYPQFKGEFPRLKGGEEITKKFVIGFIPATKKAA